MAADPNTAVFFPATLLFLLSPLSAGARAAHLFWAAVFPVVAFAALRKLGLSRFSAAVGAFALAVSGPAMTLASLPTTAWAVAFFLPLLAAAAAPAGRPAGSAVIALLFALVIAAGEPAIAGETVALAAAFLLFERRGGWKRGAAGLAAGAAVALPQIVAAAGLLPETVRRGGLAVASGAAFYSVRPLRFLGILWPGLFGDVHSPAAAGFWGNAFFDAGAPYISTLAVGTATLALLPAAARRPRGRSLLAIAGLASLLSLGRFLPGGARLLALPGLSLVRYPEKWLFFALTAALAAAAFGLDAVASGDGAARRRLAVAAAAIAGVSAAAWAAARLAPASAWSALAACRIVSEGLAASRPDILGALSRELSTVAAAGAVLLLAALGMARRPRRLAAAVGAILLVELVSRTWSSVPLAPASTFDDAPAAARAVASAGGRFYFDGEAEIADDPLRPMRPAMWGVRYAGNNDIDRFSPRRSFLFGRALASLPFSDSRKTALLRLADVRAVSSIDPSAAALPAWFASSPRRAVYRLGGGARFRFYRSAFGAVSEESARVLLLDPRRDTVGTLLVEADPGAPGGEGAAAVRSLRRRADREEIEVRSGGGWLLRSETFDRRWRAQIDGRAAPVVAADFAFQAVRIPPGEHRVEFLYADPLVAGAMALSLAALAALGWRLRRAR